MATNTVTTEQVHEAIEQLAAMVAAASISPQTVADILEMMRNLNDQERLKVIAVGEEYLQEILNTGITADKVTLDSGENVEDTISTILSTLFPVSENIDITQDADFQAKGIWINTSGHVASGTNHKVSKTILFHAGDVITFKARTSSTSGVHMIWISPTSADIEDGDTRTFTGVGAAITASDGEQTLSYTVQADCYLVFQSHKLYDCELKYRQAASGGLVEEVERLGEESQNQSETIEALSETVGDSSNGLVKQVNDVEGNVNGKMSFRPTYIFEGKYELSTRYKNGGFAQFIIDAYFDIYADTSRFYFLYSDNGLASVKLCSKKKTDNSDYTTHITFSTSTDVAVNGYKKYTNGNSFIIVNPDALSVTQYNSTTYNEGVALNPCLFKGKPQANINASSVIYGLSTVEEALNSINAELNGSGAEDPVDVTSNANFQELGIWINNGSVASSSNHKVSKTLHFNAGDTIVFDNVYTASGSLQYMMFIAPTSDDLVSGDTRAFVGVGQQISNASENHTLTYTVESDCYMIFQEHKSKTPTLIYTPASQDTGLVGEVHELDERVKEFEDTIEVITDTVTATTQTSAYTQVTKIPSGKEITVKLLTNESGLNSTIYGKTNSDDSSYQQLGNLQTVGTSFKVTTNREINYIRISSATAQPDSWSRSIEVEWSKGHIGIDEKIEMLEEEVEQTVSHFPIFMPFNNIALPKNPATYKILVIGNSFSQSMYAQILQICAAANITGLTFGRTYAGGTTLENQYKSILNKTANREFWVSENGAAFVETENVTIEYALNYTDWDMIIVHEKSERSGQIQYYNEWLPKLVGLIRSYKTTRKAKIAMQLTWAMSEDSTYTYLDDYYNGSQEYMFECLCGVYDKLFDKFGMDLVIPNHLSIQNARNDATIMSIEDISDFTGNDGLHLNDYGTYIQNATFFESIIAPMFGKTIWDNTYKFRQALTDDMMKRFKACAVLACGYKVLQNTGNSISIDNYISLNSE